MLHGNSVEHGHSHHHRYLSTTMGDMSMGTVMYMDGFHWALGSSASSGTPPPCLNLFFPSWTLYSRSRFVFGMASVTSLGILVEACGVWRTLCLRRGRARRRRRLVEETRGSSGDGVATTMPTIPPPVSTIRSKRLLCVVVPKSVRHFFDTHCDLIAAALHASRILLGYLLMLAVMSYALEFLISAVFGVVLGRYLFMDKDDGGDSNNSEETSRLDSRNGNNTWGGGGDPCCDFDDEEGSREPLLSSLALESGVSRRHSPPHSEGIS